MISTAYLIIISRVIGWIYFTCWSISFYPQLLLNYYRKSTIGLSLDYILGNTIGFFYLFTYYAFFYWDAYTQRQYRERHEGWENTIQLNDVIFALHSVILSCICYFQVFWYKTTSQSSLTFTSKVFLSLTLLISCLLLLLWAIQAIQWIDVLYGLSSIKIFITIAKYIPQVYLNYRRKSTVGWTIWNVLLDFTGGVFSIAQIFLDAIICGDLSSISGAAVKLLLGLVSITFDIIFMIQHYLLYPNPKSNSPIEVQITDEDICGNPTTIGKSSLSLQI